MTNSKTYFRDHFVLLLLSTNVFLAVLDIIFVIVKLSTSHGSDFIVEYRPSQGINTYKPGSMIDILSFCVFAAIIAVTNYLISYRVYRIHRQLAISVLSFGVLLLVLTLIVSNSLILLR